MVHYLLVLDIMLRGNCHLCDAECDLQLSHVLPAFAFRWLRNTSGIGHIRFGTALNLRVQDGLKRHWLCSSCEGVLNRSETEFATQLFHPYSEGRQSRFKYSRWLLHFCVSVSWRVLHVYREETSLSDYPTELLARLDDAERVWKEVLLGRRAHPGAFQQHVLPLDALENATGAFVPNINRYLMRAIDMDLVRGGTTNLVYSKLGRFILLGFVQESHRNHWRGTKVHATEGLIGHSNYVVPSQFAEYLNHKARRMAKINETISKRQRERIDEAFWANIDQFVKSDQFRAMDAPLRKSRRCDCGRIGSRAPEHRRAPREKRSVPGPPSLTAPRTQVNLS